MFFNFEKFEALKLGSFKEQSEIGHNVDRQTIVLQTHRLIEPLIDCVCASKKKGVSSITSRRFE